MQTEAGQLSDAAFELRLSEIVALADNGHTLLFSGPWREKFNRIPVKFIIFDGRLYIGETDEAHEDLKGLEVVRIGSHSWRETRRALGRYQGGLDQWKLNFIQNFIESPEVLHAAGLIDSADRVTLTVVNDGREKTVSFEAGAIPSSLQGFERFIPPARLVEFIRSDSDSEEDLPLYLQNAADLYRLEWLDGDIAYIQFKANAGESNGEDARAFSRRAATALSARTPSHVILDQRFNSGGDLNNTRDLMQALPGLVAEGGKVYVITSGKTFSAGISSVGYLKQAGGDRVAIVGEPVGDRLEFWAEGDVTRLPQSGAMLLYATERHNYMTGCPEDDCHGSIKTHPIAVESLQPDYPTPLTHDEFMSGRDPAMEKIMALIKSE